MLNNLLMNKKFKKSSFCKWDKKWRSIISPPLVQSLPKYLYRTQDVDRTHRQEGLSAKWISLWAAGWKESFKLIEIVQWRVIFIFIITIVTKIKAWPIQDKTDSAIRWWKRTGVTSLRGAEEAGC